MNYFIIAVRYPASAILYQPTIVHRNS